MDTNQVTVKQLKETISSLADDTLIHYQNNGYKEIITGIDDDKSYITFRGYPEKELTEHPMNVKTLKEKLECFADNVRICYFWDCFPFAGYLEEIHKICIDNGKLILKK